MALRAVIIGGGIIGCLTAIKLRENGYDVTMIDRSVIGGGIISCRSRNNISTNAMEL